MGEAQHGDPVSPLVRGVAGLLGGVLTVAGAFMCVSFLLPLTRLPHPTTLGGALGSVLGGIGCLELSRVFFRAAFTGVSPPRSDRSLSP
jgi:hypothetical protein